MPQPPGGAVAHAPVVEPATGASRPPPYDPEAVINEHGLEAELSCELPGAWNMVTFDFRTEEHGRIIYNKITFTADHSGGYVLNRDDVYAAIRGDIDTSIMEQRHGETRRRMTVDYPRPHLTAEEAVMVAERWTRFLSRRTEEERRLSREQAAQRQHAVERRKHWEQAVEQAHRTLISFLNDKQRETAIHNDYFDIVGSHGSHYRIRTDSYSGNVYWINHVGIKLAEYCGHCGDDYRGLPVPRADHNLTQMLELVTNEISWLDTAIRQYGPYPDAWFYAMGRPQVESHAYEEHRHREHYRGDPTHKPLPCPCGCGQKVPYAW